MAPRPFLRRNRTRGDTRNISPTFYGLPLQRPIAAGWKWPLIFALPPRQQPVDPMPRDNFKHGYPLIYSEDAYPPQTDPAMSRTQVFAALSAINSDSYRRERQHLRQALFFQQREEHLLAAMDRLIAKQGGPAPQGKRP